MAWLLTSGRGAIPIATTTGKKWESGGSTWPAIIENPEQPFFDFTRYKTLEEGLRIGAIATDLKLYGFELIDNAKICVRLLADGVPDEPNYTPLHLYATYLFNSQQNTLEKGRYCFVFGEVQSSIRKLYFLANAIDCNYKGDRWIFGIPNISLMDWDRLTAQPFYFVAGEAGASGLSEEFRWCFVLLDREVLTAGDEIDLFQNYHIIANFHYYQNFYSTPVDSLNIGIKSGATSKESGCFVPLDFKNTIYDFQGVKPPAPSPYDPAGPSTTGGGDGSFDNKSDPVDFTELPSLSVFNSGFVGLFKPTLSQLNDLANYLWNENLDVDWLRKLFANPIDLLISLTIMPVDPPTAGSETIKVGFRDTGISVNKIENQFMSIDLGSLEVKEYYGNALDYSPYTKISIYLPYIGLKQLNTDDIMKKTLALRYNVDLFTGACVAEIKAGESVLYTFTGNVANQIPLNAESYSSFLSGLIQAAASVGVAIASHGTSVATQGAAEAGEVSALTARGAQTASSLASMNAALTSAGAVATSKPDILHSGSMTANNGYLSGKTPYLIYEVPRACIPENYQSFVGYPSNITKALSEVSGFTVVDSIHLENIPATDSELAEIESLLRGGVIL